MTLYVQSDLASTAAALQYEPIDPYEDGSNDGCYGHFSLSFSFSYPLQADPVGADVVRDIAGHRVGPVVPGPLVAGHADGSFVKTATGPTFKGGGLDFSNVSGAGNYVDMGSSGPAAVYASADQSFLAWALVRLPLQADWDATTNSAAPILDITQAGATFQSGPSLAAISMSFDSLRRLRFDRQRTDTFGSDTTYLTPAASDFGGPALVAIARNASGTLISLTTLNGVKSSLAAGTINNGANFSTARAKFGVSPALWNMASAAYQAGRRFRLYDGGMEALSATKRDPATTLAGVWSRAMALRSASAGSNFAGYIAGNTLTVTAVAAGGLAVGQRVTGPGVIPCVITAGAGAAWTVDTAQNAGAAGSAIAMLGHTDAGGIYA